MKYFALYLLLILFALPFSFSLPPIVVRCHQSAGFGNMASGLHVSSAFKRKGFDVYLLVEPGPLRTIRTCSEMLLKIFSHSLKCLYQLELTDLYFHADNNPNRSPFLPESSEARAERLGLRIFSWSEIVSLFKASLKEDPILIFGPDHSPANHFGDLFPTAKFLYFDEFRPYSFDPLNFDTYRSQGLFKIPGIYITPEYYLNHLISDNLKGGIYNSPLLKEASVFRQKPDSKFYFSYFSHSWRDFGSDGYYRNFQFVKIVDFLNKRTPDSPILIALQNPKVIGVLFLILKEDEFTKFVFPDTCDLVDPSRVYSIGELKNMLSEEFSCELDNLFSSDIRVMFYDYLPTEDFILAAYLSDDFVGCTGDDSFSKVISLGKIPIYYAFSHKYRFWKAFLSLIDRQNLSTLHSLLDLFIKADGMPTYKASDPSFIDKLNCISLDALLEEGRYFKSAVIAEMKTKMSITENIMSILVYEGALEEVPENLPIASIPRRIHT